MQIIDTFSGIGGFSLAGSWLGWHTVQFCEIDKFCQRVLKYYWPNVPIHDDIKTLTAEQIFNNGLYDPNETTILCGGVPCQPWSNAGNRKGTEDNRNLWPETISLIGKIQPSWAVLENVRGFTNWDGGMVFDQVQADLETEGYECIPFLLPACAVNAPHRRDRIWIVAHSDAAWKRRNERKAEIETNVIADNPNSGIENMRERENAIYEIGLTSHSDRNGHELRGSGEDRSAQNTGVRKQKKRERIWSDNRGTGEPGTSANSSLIELQRRMHKEGREQAERYPGSCDSRSGRGTWEDFPTQSPICSRNDGLSSQLSGITFPKWRNESIKAMGNSIVPQVAYEIFKAITHLSAGGTNPTD